MSLPSFYFLAITLLVLSVESCTGEGQAGPSRGIERREVILGAAIPLTDNGAPLLAKPDWISEDSRGRIFATDYSDRDVKVYDARGRRVATIGRAGRGPGEFESLLAAQVYRDSLLGFDMVGARVSFFGPDGRFARALPVMSADRAPPFLVRAVDDSLLLLISPIQSGRRLLTLARADGSVRSSFLSLRQYVGTSPQALGAMGLLADARGGRVFAAVAGGDSVWAFDYDGRRLAAFAADPVQPLKTMRALVESNGGRIRRANGGYVVDGNRMVVGLVALDSGTVALQIAPFDGRLGIDLEEGGTIVVSALSGTTGRVIARREVDGALLGRDRRGRLLFLRYTTPAAEAHELVRATLELPPGAR
ncbi:MAG TPA: hypothetical protein VJT67_09780 [Longimicrobiaceae bacterium]|nr:hypothetical protein [Longimicrobiaceae bacterium]